MPLFSDETLQAVRSIPLYEIVRPHVELSRSGRNWKGLSPFTAERTPSFYVLTDKNYYKCHSSGMAGDGIRFLQEVEKLTFPEAVEALAERFNIPVRYASGGGPDPEARSFKQALLDIHEYARDYFHQSFLADHPVAVEVRRYWEEERGFPLELAREFHIGLAPPQSPRLMQRLLEKGFSHKALAACGLFHPGREGSDPLTWHPLFRGRLMVPIRDLQGQVVAFTARQLEITPRDHPSWKAKYINSPETPIFHKGQLLFNLDRAREAVKGAGRLLLVEGQLDALRCWSCGLPETIAPQGTSVTDEQVSLIKRYTDRLDLLLDSDEAGGRAALRVLPMAFKAGLEVRVMLLPSGTDPDGFLRAHGRAALEALPLLSAIRFAGAALLGKDPPTPEQRSKALQGLFQMLAACPSAVVREGYFNEAVDATGVSPQAAHADFARFAKVAMPAQKPLPAANRRIPGTNPSETLTNLEGDLIWSVLQNVGWAESLAQVIDHQWIRNHSCEGRVLSRILDHATVDHIEDSGAIACLLESDEERDCLSRYMVEDRPLPDLESFVNETVSSLARRFCRDRISRIDQDIAQLSGTDAEPVKLRNLMLERRDLLRLLQKGTVARVTLPD